MICFPIICVLCDEEILYEERHPLLHLELRRAHRECNMRMFVGSVAHQSRRCSCFGGKVRDENPKLTIRQNAQAAMDYFLDFRNKIATAKFN